MLLVLALAVGVLGRILIVVRSNAMLDGDEALVGIQAEHILQGERPFYFYGQVYMGSLETYFVAVLFRLFGPSAWVLRAVPILLSLLLVYLTWRLARALLPKDARTTPFLAGLAALFAALPPLYDATIELRAWGGQIEIYVITLALLVATFELAERLRAGARTGALALRWAIWGFIVGLGIWINPLISYGVAASVLWLAPAVVQVALPGFWQRLPRWISGLHTAEPGRGNMRSLLVVLAALPGVLIGGLPAWIYAIQNQAANLLVYVTQPSVSPAVSGAARHGRLFLGAAITAQYAICVSPRVLAGGLPEDPAFPWGPLRLLLLLPPLLGIAGSIWLASRRGNATPLRAGLPLLYAGVLTAVFCLGTSAGPPRSAATTISPHAMPCRWCSSSRSCCLASSLRPRCGSASAAGAVARQHPTTQPICAGAGRWRCWRSHWAACYRSRPTSSFSQTARSSRRSTVPSRSTTARCSPTSRRTTSTTPGAITGSATSSPSRARDRPPAPTTTTKW